MITPESPSLLPVDNEHLRRIASGFAHDFNNLLAVIAGYSELMLRRLRPNDPLRSNAESIKKTTEWGIALAQQILMTSRDPGPALIAVNQVVANVAKVLQPAVGDQITLVTRLDPGVGRVAVNHGQLGQVIMNLVVNARDAMPQGGRLTIETLNAGSDIVLVVSDTGVGMDGVTQARLFEPYFTTKEPGKGTGLGLSTVRDVVARAGGRIEVSSKVGRGSTFTIRLPRAQNATGGAEQPSGATPSGARTVLVVEDEPDVRDLIRDILQFEQYAVLEASDREAALAIVKRHEGPIDLLITDLVLPGAGGDDVARRVVAARPGIKVIYVSGYPEADVPPPALSLGPLLPKPFTIAALTQTVREVLNGAA